MQTDTERLAGNQRALLLAMPEMVLLVNSNGTIEFMNQSALKFFGGLQSNVSADSSEKRALHPDLLGIVQDSVGNKGKPNLGTSIINGFHLEYSIAPFSGYKGDKLFWIIIKNLTEEKKYQKELTRFHQNIESILVNKISELKESERVRKNLSSQLDTLKNHFEHHPSRGVMVGSSDALRRVRDTVFQIAKTDTTVLITGESGTGKELVVNMIHGTSNRKDKPLLKINCNAINDSLLESDLFGYEKGAFTGADSRRKGKFEVVDGGTIFLDEIGDISPRMQAALLRVLQDGQIIRVGGNAPIKTDVRILAATNVDLSEAVQQGSFRLDLFYRLSIININIPSLRERREDILDLAFHFLNKYCDAFNKKIDLIAEPISQKLLNHDWPGNVRELENVIQRAVLMSKENMLSGQDIVFDNTAHSQQNCTVSSILEGFNGTSLKGIVSQIEKEIILHKLEMFQGNVAMAADVLQIGKTALYEKMKRYDISPKTLRSN
ncbi:sigma-54 interaction domain-containing protein [Desulfofustis glycolicus]|uniref:Nif-specific regulatory protein n=1 Tax=Desulfofustis glycolicus DSM 9705 TaxID=1121409 RepID=A0A1M5YLQ9_9BACT|nr:sigma 54-interacting transcriptional regulator [Desulfofustis glycolicus]MCB2218509.1 sigma 54-interacting transcriptional regulator [Desulfobulbaceae bacterium]SHI12784.1 Nif-specific regulatory protein [Desulfofustis glycolicus DSM 9705]